MSLLAVDRGHGRHAVAAGRKPTAARGRAGLALPAADEALAARGGVQALRRALGADAAALHRLLLRGLGGGQLEACNMPAGMGALRARHRLRG